MTVSGPKVHVHMSHLHCHPLVTYIYMYVCNLLAHSCKLTKFNMSIGFPFVVTTGSMRTRHGLKVGTIRTNHTDALITIH